VGGMYREQNFSQNMTPPFKGMADFLEISLPLGRGIQ
jgi:hypothetical protein